MFPEGESELQVPTQVTTQVITGEPGYVKGSVEEQVSVAEVRSCVVEGARPRFAVFGG